MFSVLTFSLEKSSRSLDLIGVNQKQNDNVKMKMLISSRHGSKPTSVTCAQKQHDPTWFRTKTLSNL